ncbi:MAG: class I SAM-dependent methyltransferase, partial [Chloroflexi bacterium]|nr:class I SAM-dependent methyltransferase [Chloroflexota bacterium]
MTEHKQVYQQEGDRYQRLIAREDYQGNLLPEIEKITLLENLDVLDLGAGTGRLASLLAPRVGSVFAFDLSPHMLQVAAERLTIEGQENWKIAAADHRNIPLESASADLVISGWSFCYLAVWEDENWQTALETGLKEIDRLLREDGTVIIIETLGTGTENPQELEKLQPYFRFLDNSGFQRSWIRTDYLFQDREEALELTGFFFG